MFSPESPRSEILVIPAPTVLHLGLTLFDVCSIS